MSARGARPRCPGRSQRFGQVDAAEDRRRHDRTRFRARVSSSRASPCATCRRNRIFPGTPTSSPTFLSGLAPGDDPHRARLLLEALGMTGEENPASISGGEARRAALARTLAPEPDILLLDEPTNHLDLPAIEWLEGRTVAHRARRSCLISHDRRFLDRLSRRTIWMDRGVSPQPRFRLRQVRGLARRLPRAGGGRAPQARPQDRARAALDRPWRVGPSQAQHAPRPRTRGLRKASSSAPVPLRAPSRSPAMRARPPASWSPS